MVNPLDSVERKGLVYLVAFDLGRFELKYVLGTVHPKVDWSEHISDRMKDESLPGPDGIGTIAPLVSTGLVSPVDINRTVATFTGRVQAYSRCVEVWASGPQESRQPLWLPGKWRDFQRAPARALDDLCPP